MVNLSDPGHGHGTDERGAFTMTRVECQQALKWDLRVDKITVEARDSQQTETVEKASLEQHWRLLELIRDVAGARDPVVMTDTGACGYNRPCAHQYVCKSQSCMV